MNGPSQLVRDTDKRRRRRKRKRKCCDGEAQVEPIELICVTFLLYFFFFLVSFSPLESISNSRKHSAAADNADRISKRSVAAAAAAAC